MPRKSIKENKNIYQIAREEASLTRAKASEQMEFVPESRIEKIESERIAPAPEDIMAMAKTYKRPELCNYYCTNECPIGQKNVQPVKVEDLSQIVLEVLASLNKLSREKDRLIEISVDGEVSEDELADFARIKKELSEISLTVDTLQLWVDHTIAHGKIDETKLNEIMNSTKV